MSRISQPTVVDGDTANAASLNDRFDNFTQTDLNAFNARDAAFDLPQFDSSRFIITHVQSEGIGLNDWRHGSVITVTGQSVMPASPFVVGDGAPTVMDFGPTGLTVSIGEVLRIYWNLSVRPYWENSRPWLNPGALEVDAGGGIADAAGDDAGLGGEDGRQEQQRAQQERERAGSSLRER